MKKYGLIIAILVIVIIIGIAVFTKNTKDVKIDIEKLSEDIMQNIKFKDEMNEANIETVKGLYDIDNAIQQKVYISSGATAEEVAIFEFSNSNEANTALEKAKQRIEKQTENFRNYVPEEVEKLENAIIIKKDKYLIICVTEDEETESLIERYMK